MGSTEERIGELEEKNRKFPIWTIEKTDWKQTDRVSVTQGRKTKVLILLPLESKKEGQCGAKKILEEVMVEKD